MTAALAGLLFLAGILATLTYEHAHNAWDNRGSTSTQRAMERAQMWHEWHIVAIGGYRTKPPEAPGGDLERAWIDVREIFDAPTEERERRPLAGTAQRYARLRALPSPPEGRHALPEQPPRLALARGPR